MCTALEPSDPHHAVALLPCTPQTLRAFTTQTQIQSMHAVLPQAQAAIKPWRANFALTLYMCQVCAHRVLVLWLCVCMQTCHCSFVRLVAMRRLLGLIARHALLGWTCGQTPYLCSQMHAAYACAVQWLQKRDRVWRHNSCSLHCFPWGHGGHQGQVVKHLSNLDNCATCMPAGHKAALLAAVL